ncbi:uncharacterized protein LOC111327026 [Stylophora pistillata]|uniref:Uncharacterized protein n=1 Tax=Stylophora pistillata TaxID=50429 RepID=A0A2B4SH51_STYPI|nr:uncharacterized protein LOC111327026 [Stylophora pistillata]XP_022786848.1 uncharacterized protein LOC111327026 [Stylophora pistillata]PFX27877.1 hypothetical protein AWC38_SpisGene25879 [Stylophora pistillata]
MKLLYSFLIILTMADTCCSQNCSYANWWISFDNEGWSYCDSEYQYMTGLWRNERESYDGIYLIEHAKCCFAQDLPASCQKANWWGILDGKNSWALCPDGYFMRGLYRSGDDSWLHNIEEAQCCKPEGLPDRYYDCYVQNVWGSLDHKGLSECEREGYYMVGIFKGNCDKLYCLEEFKCCRMMDIESSSVQADETKSKE